MKKIVGCVVFLILMLGMFCTALAAPSGWKEMDVFEHGGALRYDLAVPVHTAFVAQSGKMLYQCQADPGDANAMLLNWKYVDANDNLVQVGEWEDFLICIPYPQGHDAAMGYPYVITNMDTQQTWTTLDYFEQAISFRTELGQAQGSYRISWSGTPDPKPAPWDLIMDRMDWSGDRCSYTVGAGSKMVSVTRKGRDVTISGGEIKNVVRFANQTMWNEDWEADWGWHTESGSYTFHNVTLLDDIYVWAHNGEDYKITLDASVKGKYCMICELHNGANLTLVNNDIIQSEDWYPVSIDAYPDCSMTITGNGKILAGNGGYYSEEEDREIFDPSPISVGIKGAGHDNDTALASIKAFEGNVVVSYDQIEVPSGYPQIRSYCWFNPNPNDPYLGNDIIDPATGKPYQIDASYVIKKLRPARGVMTEPLLTSAAELNEGALYRPLLVATENDQLYLRSEITEEVRDSSIKYEIHMVDAADQLVSLSKKSALYIPYPEGMDQNSALQYDVTINHVTDAGVETFSTKDGTISVTPYGFCIQVSSLSPFELSWQKAQNALPPATGDSAYPGVYAALMLLSLAVIMTCARKRA